MTARKLLLSAVALAVLLMASHETRARTIQLCNASPVKIFFAIGIEVSANDVRTHGWYPTQPGKCRSWTVSGNNFYYYGESAEQLAKWLNDGDKITWDSWINRMCVNPRDKFNNWAGDSKCSYKVGFKRIRLLHNANYLEVFEDTHKGIELSDATEHRRRLIGRMEFERQLRKREGREPPFSIGATIKNAANSGGVIIEGVQPGMTAEDLGLEPGDRIVALGGYRIQNIRDLWYVMDNLSIFGTEPIPFSIISKYDGLRYDGEMEPIFFPFNHKDYRSENKITAFGGSFIDGAFFSLSSEIFCGIGNAIKEGFRSTSEDHDFDGKRAWKDAASCADERDLELAKDALLYADAANAGSWASLIVPGIPIAKAARLGRVVPLAAKSRKVSRAPSTSRLRR